MTFKPINDVQEDEDWSDSDTTIILDGDEISFQVAAACETRGIIATNKSNEAQGTFKTRTDMNKFLANLVIPDDFYEVVDSQIAEPAKNAFATVKAKILNFKQKFKTNKVEIYMSGKGNYRLDLPLPVQYKNNRKETIRPLLLQEIRDYLVQYQGAVIIEGDEADAMLAQRMYEGYKSNTKVISCSVDKDLRITSGWCYNPDKDELLFVDGFGGLYRDDKGKVRGHGRMFLYFQCATGDSADGYDPRDVVKSITGTTPKFGDVAAFKLLSECKTDKEALKVVHDLYLKWFGSKQFSYTAWNGETFTGDYMAVLQMIWDCAFMKRFEDDGVCVRAMLKKMGIVE